VIRVLIVDDERLARLRVRDLLAGHPRFEVVGECADGPAAVRAILEQRPDLVFLDIQMPELGGFDVLRAVADDYLPGVVFVTAHDEFALQAFEFHALDYLLKPLDPRRVEKLLQRVTAAGSAASHGGLLALVGTLNRDSHASRALVARLGRDVVLLKPAEIEWLETAGNYVKLHAGGREYLSRMTMKEVESRLEADRFVRIHRSFVVNADAVRSLTPVRHGEHLVVMRDGAELRSSRSCNAAVRNLRQGNN
jgi:two-component system LytT family response regulator